MMENSKRATLATVRTEADGLDGWDDALSASVVIKMNRPYEKNSTMMIMMMMIFHLENEQFYHSSPLFA